MADQTLSIFDAYEKVTHLAVPRSTRREVRVLCPFHLDTDPSLDLSPNKNVWTCRACGRGGGIADLVIEAKLVSGATIAQARAAAFVWLRDEPAPTDLRQQPAGAVTWRRKKLRNQLRTVFAYVDAAGEPIFEVVRIDGINEEGHRDKDFLQRRRAKVGEHLTRWRTIDGRRRKVDALANGGEWVYSMAGIQRVLLDLPEVLGVGRENGTLIMTEGERKARALKARTQLCATTMPGGANAELCEEYRRQVRGVSRLIVCVDSDDAGRKAGLRRAAFFRPIVFDVRIVDLYPDRADGSDVEDWILRNPAAGATDFLALANAAATLEMLGGQ